MARWGQDRGYFSDDPFLLAVKERLAVLRAPESLRVRIGAMLVAERTQPGWEPKGDWPR